MAEITEEEEKTLRDFMFIGDPEAILRCWPHQEDKQNWHNSDRTNTV